jgi:dihydroorotase
MTHFLHSRIAPILLAAAALVSAQPYDLVLKGGHVIDPANAIDGVMDIAVSGNRIAAVGPNLAAKPGGRTVDAGGLYVVPGLIDLHMHVFGYDGSIPPDETALPAGTTTIVDAGGSGWRTFDEFKAGVIAHAKTRVLALINIVGAGMVGAAAESNTADMEPDKTALAIQRNRDVIVGIKTAHFGGSGWTAIDRAVEAGRKAEVPVMVDDKIFTNSGRTSRDKLLLHLRPGDIHTHMFNDRQLEVIDRFSGKVQPYMIEARKRGVFFDLGHGAGSFLWPVASKSTEQGFYPDSISTDLHGESILRQQSDMPNCMSKMLLLGMSLPDAVLRSTVNPAKEIKRYPELGTLGVGRGADIAVLELQDGVFAFKDAWPAKRLGSKRLECVLTVRDGQVVYQRRESAAASSGPMYDVLLKNGHVIDPANHRDARMDVAIVAGKIARVEAGLRSAHARVVVDATDYFVTPGLIEIDAAYKPDYLTLPRGVTTLALTGGAIPKSAAHAKTRVMASSKTPATSNTLDMTPLEIIERSTVTAARLIQHSELGALTPGSAADVALFEIGTGRLRCVLTLRNGNVVWDSDGLATTDWVKAGPYTNFK